LYLVFAIYERKNQIHVGVTQLACWEFSAAVLPFFLFAVFALVERKNGKRMIATYHAAAGKNIAL
jgi:hypothetical protein